MTDLGAHGIAVTLPTGWEGRVFRRPRSGEVAASAADGPPAPPGETTHAVVHLATIPLPPDLGDFGSTAVPDLGPDDLLVVLFEYGPESVSQPLFAKAGVPRELASEDFSPGVMQRAVRGQAGAQVFCTEAGRAFCLYVVIGSFSNRRRLVPRVNDVLATLDIGPASAGATSGAAAGAAATTTTTSPPTTSTSTTSTTSPVVPPTSTDPATTSTTQPVQSTP